MEEKTTYDTGPGPTTDLGPTLPLRFEDAPSVLVVPEAAALLRWHPSTLREVIKQTDTQREHGAQPADPLPYYRRGKCLYFSNVALREWTERQARQGVTL